MGVAQIIQVDHETYIYIYMMIRDKNSNNDKSRSSKCNTRYFFLKKNGSLKIRMFEINSKYKNNGTAFNDKQTPCLKSIPLFQPHKLGHNLRQASTFGSTRPPKSIHVALRCGTCCWSLRRRHQTVAEKWEKTVGKCPHSFWWHPQHCQSMPPLFRKKKWFLLVHWPQFYITLKNSTMPTESPAVIIIPGLWQNYN